MDLLQLRSGRWALLVALVLSMSNLAASLTAKYCSGMNTGSTPTNNSQWQSNGLCFDFCSKGSDYAFAIVQSKSCWCSNYVPAATVPLNKCNSPCPGYPDDLCGANNLFGYFELNVEPSGTVSSGFSSTQLSSSSTTSVSIASSSSSSSTWTPTPVESLQTVTGVVKTVTYTPTAPPTSSPTNESKGSSNKLGTGGTVGLSIGLVALAGIIGALIFFFLRRRRQQEEEKGPSRGGSSAGMGGQIPSRTMSENSRYVLGTDGRQVVETWEPSDTPGSRRSRLVPVDPRLDPFAPVYQRGDGNVSRESINTLRDDHDYSRRVHQKGPILRATNPDE